MARLAWNAPSERFFEAGLDRGVFYPKNVPEGPIDGVNEALNPRAAAGPGIISWFGGAGAGGTVIATNPSSGGWNNLPYYSLTWTVAPTSENYTERIYGAGASAPISISPGEVFSVGMRGFLNVAKPLQLIIDYYLGTTYVSTTSSSPVTAVPGQWGLYKRDGFIAPAGVDNMRISLTRSLYTHVSVGDVFSATALIVTRTPTLPNYFDGDESDGLHTQEWDGTPNNSTSTRRLIVDSAFPWNGLVSVEENGESEATTFYIDGRKYLNFPTPRDFKATLKAYTYPDAFAEVMGVAEISEADGLFADSQVGEQFGMSYRTLVGNGTNGLDHGYKIHLIYNATVSSPNASYESLSNDVNPSDLTWELDAVPVEIEGYRPTAHFIIDTRHMSADILSKIEKILYGDAVTAPYLPEPIDLIELLTYGGAIIIVDNGDGTWTAKGSRHNIYLLDEDTFRIENVETTDYGDGTFGVTTTPAP